MRDLIKRIPILGDVARRIHGRLFGGRQGFPGSRSYWERRYARGDDSGPGSYGKLARFKAEQVNAFVAERGIQSVLELGCGDGNQLKLASYPSYLGFDVSETAVARCRELFSADRSKSFRRMEEYRGEKADLALSLDVLFHLVEQEVFESYLRTLFGAALRYVIIYSSDFDDSTGRDGPHVRHRRFSAWVEANIPGWKRIRRIPNAFPYAGDPGTGSFAEFVIYERA